MVLSSTWCFVLLVWLSVCFCLFVFLFFCLFFSGWNSGLNFFVSFIHYWNKWYKIKKTKTFSFQKQYNIRKSTLIIWERFLFYYVDQIFYYHILLQLHWWIPGVALLLQSASWNFSNFSWFKSQPTESEWFFLSSLEL